VAKWFGRVLLSCIYGVFSGLRAYSMFSRFKTATSVLGRDGHWSYFGTFNSRHYCGHCVYVCRSYVV